MINSSDIQFVVSIVLALLLGSMIGYERESHKKPAGLRTHALVAGGACIFTFISAHQNGSDPTRIAAQIVTGIGFLGAGVIIQSIDREDVKHLTTATSIWYTAAIGMATGFKLFFVAIVSTILILIITALPKFK
jgi:putative Mg2+ transporter-C (MgtC) family protein